MTTGNTKVGEESYISQPVTVTIEAIKRLLDTNIGAAIKIMLITVASLSAVALLVVAFYGKQVVELVRAASSPAGEAAMAALFLQGAVLISVLALVLLIPLDLAIDYAFSRAQNKDKVSTGAAIKRGYKRLLTTIGAYVLAGLFILAGFLLFILPGIYIAIRLSYLGPVVANEDLGVWQSIKRSWELSNNNVWDIIGIVALSLAVTTPLGWIQSAIMYVLFPGNQMNATSISVSIGLFIMMSLVGILTSLGLYLRYHFSDLTKQGVLTKEATHWANYAVTGLAILLIIADITRTANMQG